MLTTTARSSTTPMEIVAWHADLLEKYEFREDLGVAEAMGRMSNRWVEKEAAGVVAAIVPYNYPFQITMAKLIPALAAGCTVIVKGPPETPWVTASIGALLAEETDIPAGVVNVLVVGGGRSARRSSPTRGRHGELHRLHRRRPPDHGRGRRHREEGVPRARWEVGVHRPRRRPARSGGDVRRVHRPARTPARAAPSPPACWCPGEVRRGDRARRRHDGGCPVRRPGRRGEDDGAAHQRAAARAWSTDSPAAPSPRAAGWSRREGARATARLLLRADPGRRRREHRRSPRTRCSARC